MEDILSSVCNLFATSFTQNVSDVHKILTLMLNGLKINASIYENKQWRHFIWNELHAVFGPPSRKYGLILFTPLPPCPQLDSYKGPNPLILPRVCPGTINVAAEQPWRMRQSIFYLWLACPETPPSPRTESQSVCICLPCHADGSVQTRYPIFDCRPDQSLIYHYNSQSWPQGATEGMG